MTTTEPPLTPGQRVWLEAVARCDEDGVTLVLSPIGVNGSPSGINDLSPELFRWRPTPDDTAACAEELAAALDIEIPAEWQADGWGWALARLRDTLARLEAVPDDTAAEREDDALAEARTWARHGYEIGQRSCTWTDHGVAPKWLTEGHDPSVFAAVPSAEPLAAGVPVGSLPGGEPDSLLWAATKPLRDKFSRSGASERLTLDAIRDVVREMFDTTPAEWDTVKAAMRDVLEERDGLRAELRRLADLANERGDELATHRAAQVRLMQHLGMEGTPDQVTDAAIQTLKLLRSEADNSQAGWDAEVRDIEKLEVERDKWEGNARRLASEVDELVRQRDEARNEFTAVRAERDEARRERDDLHRQLREVGRLACELFALADVPLVAEAQEPAQTPGGDA